MDSRVKWDKAEMIVMGFGDRGIIFVMTKRLSGETGRWAGISLPTRFPMMQTASLVWRRARKATRWKGACGVQIGRTMML